MWLRQGKTVVVVDPSLNMLSRRGRKKKYGKDVEKALLRLWELTGFASSKHLVAFIRLNHECLFNHPKLKEVLNDSELPH